MPLGAAGPRYTCEPRDANSSAILILSKEIASQESPHELFLSSHTHEASCIIISVYDALATPSFVVLFASKHRRHSSWWGLFMPSFGAYGAMRNFDGESDGLLVVVSERPFLGPPPFSPHQV